VASTKWDGGAKEARMNKKPVPETQRKKTDSLSETANIAPLDG
jgi:hypothetical protein